MNDRDQPGGHLLDRRTLLRIAGATVAGGLLATCGWRDNSDSDKGFEGIDPSPTASPTPTITNQTPTPPQPSAQEAEATPSTPVDEPTPQGCAPDELRDLMERFADGVSAGDAYKVRALFTDDGFLHIRLSSESKLSGPESIRDSMETVANQLAPLAVEQVDILRAEDPEDPEGTVWGNGSLVRQSDNARLGIKLGVQCDEGKIYQLALWRLGIVEHDGGQLSMLRTTLTEDQMGVEIVPVDATTREPLSGYLPINLGHHYTHAISPDGQSLAVIVWPSGSSNSGGRLSFIDLNNWTVNDTGVEFDQHTSQLFFAEDSRALYWTLPTTIDPAHSMPRDFELYRYDLDSGRQTTVASFPTSFTPGELRLFEDGTRLAIWGVPVDPNNITEGPPRVIIVDLVAGEIATQVEIPTVKAWQLQEQDGEAVWYRTYRPGLAWDLNQLRIYVAHPDEEWISVVDLATGELVAQQEITRPQSLFDRIFDWLVPTAQAKGNPTTSKTAVLRDDGKRLYITGTHESFTQDADGDITQPDINDLVVVDTERLEEVERMKLGTIRSMLPTLDGQYLIIESYDFDHQLTKFDMTTSEIVAQLELPSESSSRLTIFDQTVLVRIQIGSLLHKAILIDLASFTILEQRDTWTGWVSDYVNIARS